MQPTAFGGGYDLSDCTADLVAVIIGFLGERDRASFACTSSFHLLVHRTAREWQEPQDPAASAAAAGPSKPPAFGMGNVDRPRFLRPGEVSETVALVSYPRSGNSMLRGLLEKVTGIVTGSDTRPDRVLSRSLLKKGLRGEGVVDGRAWVVKTHWPERYGYRRFPAHRVILLVRNPFDAINSYFNMGMTNSHEKTLKDELYRPLAGLWDEMLKNEVRVWARFNAHWLKRGLPLLAVRYEDLLLHPEDMLVRLVAFLEKLPEDAVRASPAYMARVRRAAGAVKRPLEEAPTASSPAPTTPAPAAAPAGAVATASAATAADGREDGDGDASGSNPPAAAAGATEAAAGAGAKGGEGAEAGSGRVSDPLYANRPRKGGKIGVSLRHYSAAQIKAMCDLEGRGLSAFGYNPLTQNFPNQMLSLPPYERCVKFMDKTLPPPPAAAAAAAGGAAEAESTTVNKGRQIRDARDKFGRSITQVRHALTDDDRVPLPTISK